MYSTGGAAGPLLRTLGRLPRMVPARLGFATQGKTDKPKMTRGDEYLTNTVLPKPKSRDYLERVIDLDSLYAETGHAFSL